ncbi:MAG: B12-binding domain-containing radical SAM protein [Planctomycetes bacterium]|nr:B12-binding domain-containing radical SAM protein [Planctomycetota bacterium]
MKILLINISLRPDSSVMIPPIGLGYIATAIDNAGYSFDLIDLDVNKQGVNVLEERFSQIQYDVVLMGCIITGYKMVKQISACIKKFSPEATIILGNTVGSSIPEHLLENNPIDIIVLGEGDETVVELLGTLKSRASLESCRGIAYRDNGNIVYSGARERIKNLDSLPIINWDLFDVEKYINGFRNAVDESSPLATKDVRVFPLNTARGCIHKCTFCYHAFKAYPYRRRSNENILDEIESLINKYGVNTIYFSDDLTFYSKGNTAEFVDMIEKRGLKFYWRGSCCPTLMQEDSDVELARKMLKAGCTALGFSLESADETILKAMKKKHTPEQFLKQSQILREAGIVCSTSLVLGYPTETAETIKRTMDCCIKAKTYPSVGYLLPQPGSWAFGYACENGYIKDMEEYLMKMGDRQDLYLNMTQMPDEEFESIVHSELKRCNEELNVGLSNDSLIKTKNYRKAKI